jgi:molybdate transport system regulatory protein
MTARAKAWICFGPRTKLGAGRARLLELIDELGSIQKAVAQMGMSYRSAWGYLGELEAAAGFPFLERQPGRPAKGPRGGTRLTPAARRMLTRYRALQRDVDRAVAVRFRARHATAAGPHNMLVEAYSDRPRAGKGR